MTSLYKEAGSRALALLDTVAGSYEEILGKNLVGIYAHGSLAFGCFSWERSDIDFLVVAKSALALNEKVALLDVLTRLEDKAPARGFEMSVVSEKDCRDFVYPTPFDLHFSALHREKYKIAPQAYCSAMHGTDKDLAAHFTVTKAVGKTIRGRSVSSVFGDVPRADYIDSLLTDISDSPKKTEAFGYAVLSLCRTLAFLREDRIVSKLEGGHWALKNLPKEYVPVVAAALDEYIYGIPFSIPEEEAEKFFRDMRARLPN